MEVEALEDYNARGGPDKNIRVWRYPNQRSAGRASADQPGSRKKARSRYRA